MDGHRSTWVRSYYAGASHSLGDFTWLADTLYDGRQAGVLSFLTLAMAMGIPTAFFTLTIEV